MYLNACILCGDKIVSEYPDHELFGFIVLLWLNTTVRDKFDTLELQFYFSQ